MPTTKTRNRWQRPKVRAGSRNSRKVQDLLDVLAKAITSGDGRAAAKHWTVPALVLGDDTSMPVGTLEEVEKFFGGAKEQYNQRGITDTRGEILRLEWLTDALGVVDVRWPYLDERGEEKGEEASTYILRKMPGGEVKIQGAIMRGEAKDL